MRPDESPEEPPFEVIFEDAVESKVATEAQRPGEIPLSESPPAAPRGEEGENPKKEIALSLGDSVADSPCVPLEAAAKKPPKRSRWSWAGLALLLLVGGAFAASRLPIRKQPEPTPSAPTPAPIAKKRPTESVVRGAEKHLPKPPPIAKLVARVEKPKAFTDPVTFVPQEEKKEKAPVAPPKAVEKSPATAWLDQAKGAEKDDPAKAAELYAKVLEAEPERTELWRTMGQLWLRAGDRDAASAAFRAHLERSPADVGSLNDLAVLEMQAGRREAAADLFARAVREKPTANVWFNFGNLHLREGRPEAASDAYRKAVDLDAAHEGARNNLAIALERQGRFREAATVLADGSPYRVRLLALAGESSAIDGSAKLTDPIALTTAAAGFEAADQLDQALVLLDRAVEAGPENAIVLHERGAVHQRRGDLERAASDYLAALKSNPRQIQTHLNLGSVRETQKEYVQALQCYEAVLRIDPEHVAALNNIGALYLRVQDPKKAAGLFRRAIQVDPKFAVAHLNLGWAYMAMESKSEALAELKAYAALVPKVEAEVQQAIERLSE